MLIVRKSQGGGPDFLQEHEIGLPLPIAQCPTTVEPVLVHIHAVEVIVSAVEEKAVVRIYAEIAEPERLADEIGQVRSVVNLGERSIQIRIVETVPEMWIGN